MLLRDLRALSSAGVVALKEHLLMLSLNVISRMALGGKYVGEGTAGSPISPAEFRWMVDELFLLNGVWWRSTASDVGGRATSSSPQTRWTCCWSSPTTPTSRSPSNGMASRDSLW